MDWAKRTLGHGNTQESLRLVLVESSVDPILHKAAVASMSAGYATHIAQPSTSLADEGVDQKI